MSKNNFGVATGVFILALQLLVVIYFQSEGFIILGCVVSLFTMPITLSFYFWGLRNMQVCYSALEQVKRLEKKNNVLIKTYSAPRSSNFLFFSLSKLWDLHIFYTDVLCLSAALPIILYVEMSIEKLIFYSPPSASLLVINVVCGRILHLKLIQK